jgi:hypothetical protein
LPEESFIINGQQNDKEKKEDNIEQGDNKGKSGRALVIVLSFGGRYSSENQLVCDRRVALLLNIYRYARRGDSFMTIRGSFPMAIVGKWLLIILCIIVSSIEQDSTVLERAIALYNDAVSENAIVLPLKKQTS